MAKPRKRKPTLVAPRAPVSAPAVQYGFGPREQLAKVGVKTINGRPLADYSQAECAAAMQVVRDRQYTRGGSLLDVLR